MTDRERYVQAFSALQPPKSWMDRLKTMMPEEQNNPIRNLIVALLARLRSSCCLARPSRWIWAASRDGCGVGGKEKEFDTVSRRDGRRMAAGQTRKGFFSSSKTAKRSSDTLSKEPEEHRRKLFSNRSRKK